MYRVMIYHACGCAEWHDLPRMSRGERAVRIERLKALDCPLHWSGTEEEYRAAWGLPPVGWTPPAADADGDAGEGGDA